jgi:hypothetical protein
MNLSKADIASLRYAKSLLENPGIAAKITNFIGVPIEKGFELLPKKWGTVVSRITKKSLEKALHFALVTLNDKPKIKSKNIFHKIAVGATGAGGGYFGLAGLSVELPVSTTIMLRSIADIARSEGERLQEPETKLDCLEVFAFGGRRTDDDAVESAYFAIRAVLAKEVSAAAQYIAEREVAEEGAPVLVRLITKIASRFGMAVSEKVAAQAVPIIGSAGGAVINVLFIDHFQDMARGHFIVRRLERTYNPDLIREEYERL